MNSGKTDLWKTFFGSELQQCKWGWTMQMNYRKVAKTYIGARTGETTVVDFVLRLQFLRCWFGNGDVKVAKLCLSKWALGDLVVGVCRMASRAPMLYLAENRPTDQDDVTLCGVDDRAKKVAFFWCAPLNTQLLQVMLRCQALVLCYISLIQRLQLVKLGGLVQQQMVNFILLNGIFFQLHQDHHHQQKTNSKLFSKLCI